MSIQDPRKAQIIQGIPNFRVIFLSKPFPEMITLNRLLRKWTIQVITIASSSGKNRANTGSIIVPIQNPEKKVSIEAKKATIIGSMKNIDLWCMR